MQKVFYEDNDGKKVFAGVLSEATTPWTYDDCVRIARVTPTLEDSNVHGCGGDLFLKAGGYLFLKNPTLNVGKLTRCWIEGEPPPEPEAAKKTAAKKKK